MEFALPLALGATAGTVPSGLLVIPGLAVTGFTSAFDCASVDVVDETCRDPDDRRPLDEPLKYQKYKIGRCLLLKRSKMYQSCWVNVDCSSMLTSAAAEDLVDLGHFLDCQMAMFR